MLKSWSRAVCCTMHRVSQDNNTPCASLWDSDMLPKGNSSQFTRSFFTQFSLRHLSKQGSQVNYHKTRSPFPPTSKLNTLQSITAITGELLPGRSPLCWNTVALNWRKSSAPTTKSKATYTTGSAAVHPGDRTRAVPVQLSSVKVLRARGWA